MVHLHIISQKNFFFFLVTKTNISPWKRFFYLESCKLPQNIEIFRTKWNTTGSVDLYPTIAPISLPCGTCCAYRCVTSIFLYRYNINIKRLQMYAISFIGIFWLLSKFSIGSIALNYHGRKADLLSKMTYFTRGSLEYKPIQ